MRGGIQNPPNAPPGSEALQLNSRQAAAATISLENRPVLRQNRTSQTSIPLLHNSVHLLVLTRPSAAGFNAPPDTETDRKLVPRKQLDELQEFWMIESRLVNSLGSISRDLGRELSLNDFLSALAPDLIDDSVNPIVLEAEKIEESIIFGHTPKQVVFSRKQQQTNVRWCKGESWRAILEQHRPWLDKEAYAEVFERAVTLIDVPGIHIDHRHVVIQQALKQINLFELAEISGDEDSVRMIKTKVCPILHCDSAAGASLNALRAAYTTEVDSSASPVTDKALVALVMMGLISWVNANTFLDNERDDQATWARKLWDAITQNDVFRRLPIIPEIAPSKLDDVYFANQSFDVSTYWYNWDQF